MAGDRSAHWHRPSRVTDDSGNHRHRRCGMLQPPKNSRRTGANVAGTAFELANHPIGNLPSVLSIAVLDPAGKEIRRISSPLFDSPWGLEFMGQSLLVTNADIQPVESPDRWKVLKVFVGEAGLALNRPRAFGVADSP